MTAVKSQPGKKAPPWRTRRRFLPVLAAAGAWSVCLAVAAPAAVAQDARSQQWYLDAMQAEKFWKASTGKGVKVAVVDTGVNKSTPSLRGQVLPGKDISGAPGGPNDDDVGHGTTVAELIAGTGKDGGLKGIAPDAEIIPFRARLEGVKGIEKGGFDTTYQAIRAAANSDAKIINMSFADMGSDGLSREAVEYAAKKGKLLFAGTGNNAKEKNGRNYPAAYPQVVGVGATDEAGKVSDFSQHGEDVTLVAPGQDIPEWCDGGFKRYCAAGEGTSYSTGVASGSAALVWAKHPDWTANQVLRVLIETAGRASKSKNPSQFIGYGEVRPRMNLLEGKGDPGDADVNPLTGEGGGSGKGKGVSDSASAGADSGKENAGDAAEVADSTESDDNSQLWTILGAGAAVVVLGGGAFAFVRMRRG